MWTFYAAFTLILTIAIGQVETDVSTAARQVEECTFSITSHLTASIHPFDIQAEENVDDASAKTDKGWGLALSIISLITIIFTLGSHLNQSLRSIIIDQKPEGGIILLLTIFSTILVAIVSGPDRGLAVDKDGAVFIGNMYYFAWAGFINSIFIASSFIESAYGFNVRQTMRARSSSFTYWSALLVSSMIVMATSSDIYNRNCDVPVEDKAQPFCSRTVLAITVGTIGVIFALAIVAMKMTLGAAPFLIEIGLNLMLFISYVLEIAYVTDIQGPGSPLGNLYYFSWISFLLTIGVGKACREDYMEAQAIMEEQRQRQGGGERPMPTLASVGLGVVDEDEVI